MKIAVFNAVRNFFINQSLKNQRAVGQPDVGLWGLSFNKNMHLTVNGVSTLELLATYGTPLLVVNKSKLLKDAAAIQTATRALGENTKVLYSYKTNCIPGILQELHAFGLGAEVISPYELWLAEQLKVPGEEIVYNGVNKTDESLERAVKLDVLAINIDGLSEIERIVAIAKRQKKRVRVGIRLAFSNKSQFGLDIQTGEAMAACRQLCKHAEWLEFNTVHFCVASNVKEAGTHRHFAAKALQFIQAIKEQTGVTIRYLDIGGGIGVPTSKNMSGAEYGLYRLFGCLPKSADPAEFEPIESFVRRIGEGIRETSARLNIAPPTLLVEPGRFVTSRGEFLLSSVLAVKEKSNGAKFAITDAGRLSLTFPCDFETHAIFPVDQSRQGEPEPYNVMGRICTSADWMAKNLLLPKIQEGDVLATMDAGAYFSSYSSNFAFPRPAIVMVDDEQNVEVIREAESFEHLVANDTVFQ